MVAKTYPVLFIFSNVTQEAKSSLLRTCVLHKLDGPQNFMVCIENNHTAAGQARHHTSPYYIMTYTLQHVRIDPVFHCQVTPWALQILLPLLHTDPQTVSSQYLESPL